MIKTKELLRLTMIGLLTTISFISCYGRPGGPGGSYGGHMMGYGFGGGYMWIIWIVLIGLVVYFVVMQRRGDNPFVSGPDKRERPIDILKKRYARGEISKEEYERLKKDIES